MEDAQFLTDNPDKALQIALALFDKRCDKVSTRIQKAFYEKSAPNKTEITVSRF